jgi:L-ribulokinase
MTTYLIGLDYGTESARGVLLDAATGDFVGEHVHAYRHGVMDRTLPNGTPLPSDWALQDANDYLEAAEEILRALAKIVPTGSSVASIGIDFTASTPLPTLADGTPLSRLHPGTPHAYVKLWKHHAAQSWADQINASGANFLRWYGGKTSSEWLPAKAAQLQAEAPDMWRETARFIEAGDWLVWQLTGFEVRSACQAGYKAHYQAGEGYPSDPFDIDLESRVSEPVPVGTSAGNLKPEWLERTGLPGGPSGSPAVAVATIDAHAAVPAVGVSEPGVLVGIMGTSACHLLLDPQRLTVQGISGVVMDGILPGLWGYEAGQAGFGDLLNWFVRSFPSGQTEAESFAHYNLEAANLDPGQTGLVALDWWNGCRTPLVNAELSGLMIGMTLRTTPTDMYRAILESLCYGTRTVLETFRRGNAQIHRLVLTGGLAERNPLLMQLMADITGLRVDVPEVSQASARGAAMHGAVAAKVVPDFAAAVARYGAKNLKSFEPRAAAQTVYNDLYAIYSELSASLGDARVMQQLRALRHRAEDLG